MSAGLKLQGQFKFDLYDKSGNLLKSSDFINNFITQSGLMYPIHFAFADCFRFLSVGSGDAQNSIRENIDETTGLNISIPELSYIGGRNSFDNADSTNYASKPSCGFRFPSENIVELYRVWTLPNNIGDTFQVEGTFKEFAVSPGRPYVVAVDPGDPNITKKLCSCNDTSGSYVGKDCSAIADYYNFVNINNPTRLKICDATIPFARILHNLDYQSGSILNVTYKLSISINSGLRLQEMNYSNSFSDNFNGKWNIIQGVTQPGLKLINNGFIDENKIYSVNNQRLQHFGYNLNQNNSYNFKNEYGESFIPPHGIPLEPSVHNPIYLSVLQDNNYSNVVYYLSEDNIQFLVSSSGGPFVEIDNFAPWNFYDLQKIYSSGDYAYSGNTTYQYVNQIPNSGKPLNDTSYWQNLNYLKVVDVSNSGIKLFKNDNESIIYSKGISYWNESVHEYNIRIVKQSDSKLPDTGDILFYKSNLKRNYFNSSRSAGNFSKNDQPNLRTRIFSKTFNFQGFSQSKFYIKSLVGSYKDLNTLDVFSYSKDTGNYIPFLDSIFSGSGQGIFIPKILTGVGNYVGYENTGASISGSDSDQYFYLDSNAAYPIFTDILKWTADCPSSVLGCW